MNKTISINLGGRVFNIEEEAFIILKNYLESIRANFSNDPASGEIMSDIEERIAEIFHERNNDIKNVVVREDVDAMMAIMGRPEDYRMDEENNSSHQRQDNTMRNSKRKIYRDTDDAVIAGVCSGLSHYLGWDPIVVRLIVAILAIISFFGPIALGYLLFWALVPPAKSTAEKLHMRGENATVESIGRFVNQEAKAAADRVQKFGSTASQTVRNSSGDFIRGAGRLFSVIFGLFILMMGFGLLIGLFSLLIFSDVAFLGFDGSNWEMMNKVIFNGDGTIWVLIIGVVLAMATPAVGLIYAAIKLITGSTKKIKGLGISLISLFIIGLILCTYGGIKTGKQFSRNAELSSSSILGEVSSDTLHFEVLPDTVFIGRSNNHHEFFDLVKLGPETNYFGQAIDVDFIPTSSQQFKVVITKESQGASMEQAGQLAKNINYEYVISNDTLRLSPFITTPANDIYRGQQARIRIYIPIGKYVHFGENSRFLTYHGGSDDVLRMSEDYLEDVNEAYLDDNQTVKVSDDSVIIKTDELEIKAKRND